MARWQVLRPHIEDGVPTVRLAVQCGVAARTLQQWAARYRADGLAGLARSERADRGARRFPRRADHRRLRPRLRALRARECAPVVELPSAPVGITRTCRATKRSARQDRGPLRQAPPLVSAVLAVIHRQLRPVRRGVGRVVEAHPACLQAVLRPRRCASRSRCRIRCRTTR